MQFLVQKICHRANLASTSRRDSLGISNKGEKRGQRLQENVLMRFAELQHGNGIRDLGNFSLASSDNVTGNEMASRPRIVGGHIVFDWKYKSRKQFLHQFVVCK